MTGILVGKWTFLPVMGIIQFGLVLARRLARRWETA